MTAPQRFDAMVFQIDESLWASIFLLSFKKGLTMRLDGLTPEKAIFVEKVLEQIYRAKLPETVSHQISAVLDEVHRLLPSMVEESTQS